MPLQATSGAASYDAFGGGVPFEPTYIEQIFSTFLYTGNGSTQTITNGIDLAGEGGLVWIKPRNQGGTDHWLQTSNLGFTNSLKTNSTSQLLNGMNIVGSVSSTGFTDTTPWPVDWTIASWTFRKQPKFFDVVTYTGDGTSNRAIPHNLTSAPGMVAVKVTSTTGNWNCWHRGLSANNGIRLNLTDQQSTFAVDYFGNGSAVTVPTSTNFYVGSLNNTSGQTYVAYIFAHDAGGFGLTGTDNVISCGSYTGAGTVDLGYEPQWVMYKRTESTGPWYMNDTMRGFPVSGNQAFLYANSSDAESSGGGLINLTSTGFTHINAGSYIYIAIRRGPMKVPTTGTSVFSPVAQAGGGTVTTNFPTDLVFAAARNIGTGFQDQDRLRGFARELYPYSTSAEVNNSPVGYNLNQSNISFSDTQSSGAYNWVYECFRRAPGFMDVCCYTGNGSTQTITHNLGVAPELIIVKNRSTTQNWRCLYAATGGVGVLNLDAVFATSSTPYFFGNNTVYVAPTASVFTVGDAVNTNESGSGLVAYLFATCPGVSKVGSVTHSEPTTVSCGFTPRFIMIKSTTATGTDDWFVFDSARGLVPGNDPYLRLNSTGAENTPFGAADLVDVTSDGFIMNGFNGGNYIFLAIA
jgi:hypothetical protein